MFKDFTKYEIYDDGRIWSYKTKRFLKPKTEKNGYQRVALSDNEGNIKKYLLHRVVYEAVTGSPIPSDMQCNHINECKSDNRFCNINLLSQKENINFGTRNERASKSNTNRNRSKSVGAYKEGKLVMAFPSSMEAERNGFNHCAIVMCCNCKRKTHNGFEWRYI